MSYDGMAYLVGLLNSEHAIFWNIHAGMACLNVTSELECIHAGNAGVP